MTRRWVSLARHRSALKEAIAVYPIGHDDTGVGTLCAKRTWWRRK